MTVADRLAAIRARIDAACEAAGRDRAAVRLLAASKTRPPEEVVAAVAAGHGLFGENRAQELRDKAPAVDAAADAAGLARPEWHFIGALQRNKVKYVVGRATLIHAVDSLRLAEAIGKRQRSQGLPGDARILIEVNVGGEASKAGVPPDAALDLAHAAHALDGVSVAGLMTIPPPVDRPGDAGPYFAQLARLAADGRAAGLPLDELSMGMSGDFEEAIRHGATIVRVGTAIFGQRG